MRIVLLVTILTIWTFPFKVLAKQVNENKIPVLLKADEVEYDRELSLVVARGNVELIQGKRILTAQTVTYNQKDDLMSASGDVAILSPEGDVVFADHAEITGDFKNGIADNIRLLLADNSRAVAFSGRMSNGKITKLRRGVYTPCQSCEGIKGVPLWQIKAYKIIHDREDKTIEYQDAFMEMFGIPVAYTPYLSHPDPTVKRRTGLLPISGGNNSKLGTFARIPYFVEIGTDKDITVELISTTNGGQILNNEYRQRFASGIVDLDFSGTVTDIKPKTAGASNQVEGKNKPRGHLFGHFRHHAKENLRAGGDIRLSSDDTYLQRYSFSNDTVLENNFFVEAFDNDSYIAANTYLWQDLRPNNRQGDMPIVAPFLQYNYVSPLTRSGGNLEIDANFTALTRTNGTDSRRISVRSAWNQRAISTSGHLIGAFAMLQTDLYQASQVSKKNQNSDDTSSGFAGRIYPRVGFEWRYPLEKILGTTSLQLEPIAGMMVSPRGGNPALIPDEDSQAFEFDDTNLTSRNLFSGRDRVEGGQRLYFGLSGATYRPSGYSSIFFGQSYRLNNDDTFPSGSGVDGKLSDYVGRVMIRPSLPLDIIYRFQIDQDTLAFRRNSVFINAGPPALNVQLDYNLIDVNSGSASLPNREEISVRTTSRINESWKLRSSLTHDLTNKFTSSQSISLTYICDCFNFDVSYNRSFVQDREIEPTDTVLFQLTFKNLGTFNL